MNSPGSLYLDGIEDLVRYSNTHPEWFGVVTDKGGLCLFSLEAPGRGAFNSWEKVGARSGCVSTSLVFSSRRGPSSTGTNNGEGGRSPDRGGSIRLSALIGPGLSELRLSQWESVKQNGDGLSGWFLDRLLFVSFFLSSHTFIAASLAFSLGSCPYVPRLDD